MGCVPNKGCEVIKEPNETIGGRNKSMKFNHNLYIPERSELRLRSKVLKAYLKSPDRLKVVIEAHQELEISPIPKQCPVII